MHGRRRRKISKKGGKKLPSKDKDVTNCSEGLHSDNSKLKIEETSVSSAPSPVEILISDESSMEVEIKIVEETTPIHKQLTSFVSIAKLV